MKIEGKLIRVIAVLCSCIFYHRLTNNINSVFEISDEIINYINKEG